MNNKYLFQSERLGFRNWTFNDIQAMSSINANPTVMQYFPSIQDEAQTRGFIKRMQMMFNERDYCYFATDRLDNGHLIGFIGLAYQVYEAHFTPCVDIGWRLHPSEWGRGFATEGAKECLAYGFNQLGLKKIVSVAPAINLNSINVMKKIGMQFKENFKHPKLQDFPKLEECTLYEIEKV
jgi:RimJ/RimL family protein N-acetyltransferase